MGSVSYNHHMKKYLTIFILLLIISSCKPKKVHKQSPVSVRGAVAELDTASADFHLRVKVYSFQGCEYIVVGFGKEKWGSHKGNCQNPIHNRFIY